MGESVDWLTFKRWPVREEILARGDFPQIRMAQVELILKQLMALFKKYLSMPPLGGLPPWLGSPELEFSLYSVPTPLHILILKVNKFQ